MIQELFRIGPLAISPFGVLLVLAFLVGYWRLRAGMKIVGIGGEDDASAILFAAGVGGIAGAKIYYAILHGDWRLLLERSGLVWYGGFIVAAVAVIWVIRRRRLPVWPLLDAATPALALAYGIGRIGCFLVGDDYGRPTTLPWGVAFANGLPPTTAGYLRQDFGLAIPAGTADDALLRVHPTQLYETALAILIFWIGARLLKRGGAPGHVALPLFALLAVERFAIEFLRAKDDRYFGIFTLAQGISVAILLGIAWTAWLRQRRAATAVPGRAPAAG